MSKYEKEVAELKRKLYYDYKRNEARKVAEFYKYKALSNAQFMQAALEVDRINVRLWGIGVEDEGRAKLLAQRDSLYEGQNQILAELGIERSQLIPQYSCQKCRDTGDLMESPLDDCDCYDEYLRRLGQ